jgi:hypothetical protein
MTIQRAEWPKGASMIDLLASHPKGEPVPAISLMQPWAGAVAWLGKDVENRKSWPFRYRGPMIIHASATKVYLEDFAELRGIATRKGFPEEIVEVMDVEREDCLEDLLVQGAIVAVAQLADVFGPADPIPPDHPVSQSPWRKPALPYALHFSAVQAVEPVAFKGAVGLFKVPYSVAANLREA